MRKLFRPTEGRVVGGVCAGLGRYFDIDPVLFRLGFVVFGLCGAGILAYFIALFVIPSEQDVR